MRGNVTTMDTAKMSGLIVAAAVLFLIAVGGMLKGLSLGGN